MANLELVRAARDGDRDAFDLLMTSLIDELYRVARLILRDADRAEDAVQEALVRCWRDLRTLRDPERFEAWLHRLIVNACADQGRQRRRWSAHVQEIRAEPQTEDGARALADRDQLERGFRRLKPEQRAVVVLRHYLGLPIAEVAETLGIPVGTAKSRLHYAIEALHAALEADARPRVAPDGTTA